MPLLSPAQRAIKYALSVGLYLGLMKICCDLVLSQMLFVSHWFCFSVVPVFGVEALEDVSVVTLFPETLSEIFKLVGGQPHCRMSSCTSHVVL